MDFGHRVWRLRAETPDAARKWVLLLGASQLAASSGNHADFPDDDDWSDSGDSVCSNDSLASAASTVSARPRLQAPSGGKASPNHCPLPRLPVNPASPGFAGSPIRSKPVRKVFEPDFKATNPAKLDQHFEVWLGGAGGGTCSGGEMRAGLAKSLGWLWAIFGGTRSDVDGDAALGTLQYRLGDSRPGTLQEDVDRVYKDYLSSLSDKLERWIQKCDPSADELRDVARWYLDTQPELDRFQAAIRQLVTSAEDPDNGSGDAMTASSAGWSELIVAIERMLLAAWEQRSYNELCARSEATDKPVKMSPATAALPGGPASEAVGPQPAAALIPFPRRTVGLLQALDLGVGQFEMWGGHASACDYAARVLIATLNALLRTHRGHVQELLAFAAPKCSADDQGKRDGVTAWMRRMLAALNLSSKTEDMPALPQEEVLTAIMEASVLVEFCRVTVVKGGSPTSDALCRDVLSAFADSFERSAMVLCTVLMEVHFVAHHRQAIKALSVSSRAIRRTKPQGGVLADISAAASAFIGEALGDVMPAVSRLLASDAAARLIVRLWARAFVRRPPHRLDGLQADLEANVVVLGRLGERWGAIGKWHDLTSEVADPRRPLQDVCAILQDGPPDDVSEASGRIGHALGDELGLALIAAAQKLVRGDEVHTRA